MEFILFLFVLEIIGLLSLPLARIVAGNLYDEGYSLARPLGITCISLIAWSSASIHLLRLRTGIYAGLLVLGITMIYIIMRVPNNWKLTRNMLLQEGVFIATLTLAALFLMHKPEIYFSYSEDFMDSAFFQSILHTDYLPPPDPWYAGASLPYYYFGHLAAAVLVVLSGVKAVIGYNLAVAAFFAIGVQTAFGIGNNLSKKWIFGVLSSLFVMILGFPFGFVQLLGYFANTDILQFTTFMGQFFDWLVSFDFTAATCIIPNAITFYPFYTFLQGDLHSHFISIPFFLAFLGLCIALSQKFFLQTFSALVLLTGFLAGINLWTLPVTLLVLALTGFYATKKKIFLFLIGLETCAFLVLFSRGIIGIVDPGQKTEISAFFLIFGGFMVLSLLYLADSHKFSREDILFAGAIIILGIISFSLHFPLAVLALFAIPFFFRAYYAREFPAAFGGIALCLILFCEIFYINDPYGPPAERMNTIMKFYLQAWVLWGVALGYFIYRMQHRVLVAGVIIVILITAIHPLCTIIAIPNTNYMGNTENFTLDGSAWLEEQKPGDYGALCWLAETADDGDVVLEAPGDAYTYSSRVTAFTGLPTVIGWRTHEIMWGREWPNVEEHSKEVEQIYAGDKGIDSLLKKYNIKYIFIGETEREKYGSQLENLTRYEGIKLVYEAGFTRVYRVM